MNKFVEVVLLETGFSVKATGRNSLLTPEADQAVDL